MQIQDAEYGPATKEILCPNAQIDKNFFSGKSLPLQTNEWVKPIVEYCDGHQVKLTK